MRRSLSSAAALLSAAILASCGGNGSAIAPSTVHGGASAPAAGQTLLRVRFPGGTAPASGRRGPLYVSRATQGLGVSYGASPASFPAVATPTSAFDVSATSSLCIADPNGLGGRSCTLTIPAPSGTDDFQITAWDAVPASGSFSGTQRLSGTTVLNRAIATGQQNTLAFTLDGVVVSVFVAVAPSSLALKPPASPSQTAQVSVNATDADGNIILEPVGNAGNYTDASGNTITMTLTQSGANGGPVLTSFQGQSSSTGPITVVPGTGPITVTYSGGTTSGTVFTATTSSPIAGNNAPGTLTIQ